MVAKIYGKISIRISCKIWFPYNSSPAPCSNWKASVLRSQNSPAIFIAQRNSSTYFSSPSLFPLTLCMLPMQPILPDRFQWMNKQTNALYVCPCVEHWSFKLPTFSFWIAVSIICQSFKCFHHWIRIENFMV